MRIFSYLTTCLIAVLLSACGGGGGNPGTASGTSGSTTNTTTCTTTQSLINGVCVAQTTATATRLTVQLQDTKGATVQSIPVNGGGVLVLTLTDTTNKPVANNTVEVGGSGFVFFPNGQKGVTNSEGVARIKVDRANTWYFGSDTFSARFYGQSYCYVFDTASGCYASSDASLDFRVDPPLLKLALTDSTGTPTNGIGSSGFTTLRATLKFEDGTPVIQKRVDITGDLTKISFPEGDTQLTDDSGVATIKIKRASDNVTGAGTLKGSSTISGTTSSGSAQNTVVTAILDYTVGVARLTLSNLDIGASTLSAYGTRPVSAQANINGVVSTTVPVQITFAASCGQVSPTTVLTNGSGIAAASYTATGANTELGCGGRTVVISASAVGADALTQQLTVLPAPATNLSFVIPADPTKMRIYLANSGGPTQAIAQFVLTNARGEALMGQDVRLTLKTVNGGIPKATLGTVGNVSPVIVTTDSEGKVSVPVFSGTVPTNVLVNAALVSNSVVQTDSSLLVIASGRPAQSRVSLSLGKFAIRGYNFDGEETTVTMSLADRQGNPVPDGTVVNFVTEGGVMIPPTCTTGGVAGNSQCTVKIRTQNPRPVNGLVSILAYSAGEEDFVDANFNNVYDCGESFTDLGTAYRDDTQTADSGIKSFVTGEFSVPRSASPSECKVGSIPSPTVGDGVWGASDVRQQALIVFSTDDVSFANPKFVSSIDGAWGTSITTRLDVSIQDMLGNSVPTGSTLTAVVSDNTQFTPSFTPPGKTATVGVCTLNGQSHTAVPNSLVPLGFSVFLKECVSGDQVKITVDTPAGSTATTFVVP